MGKNAAKRKLSKGEDGGAALSAVPPVHFLVCSQCGTVGAASIVNVHDAKAILRIVRRAQAQAEAAWQRSRSVATYGSETRPRGPAVPLAPVHDSPKEVADDEAQTKLF